MCSRESVSRGNSHKASARVGFGPGGLVDAFSEAADGGGRCSRIGHEGDCSVDGRARVRSTNSTRSSLLRLVW